MMNVIIRRRQLIVATLVVALGAAVFVNWYFSGDAAKVKTPEVTTEQSVQTLGEAQYVNATVSSNAALAEARMKRQKDEDAAMEDLQDALEEAESGSAEASTLTDKLTLLTDRRRAETDAETRIAAKLGADCVVIVSEKGADVLAPKGSVNEDSALQICEIVTDATGLQPADVTITESK